MDDLRDLQQMRAEEALNKLRNPGLLGYDEQNGFLIPDEDHTGEDGYSDGEGRSIDGEAAAQTEAKAIIEGIKCNRMIANYSLRGKGPKRPMEVEDGEGDEEDYSSDPDYVVRPGMEQGGDESTEEEECVSD